MKSRLLTLICILLFSFGFAQDTDYGVRAALNISNLDFDPDATFDNQHRNGFAFAAFADFGISDNFSALVELQYSAEGAKADDLRADYIQMPIMARIGIGDKLKVGVGPMVSLKTWKEQDAFSTFTFSGVGGLEYMITDELFVDARVHYGLSNILDEDLNGNLEAQNTTFQFGVGLKL
ncbi:outer membrane beta-barrel protein [Psychroserpens sp.]|uniref:outer membrane beta-barrel protein n=1 Tax=Psychroserpens sp. TaxID=2020870 RepID=UPI001AFE1B6D|nr:outer membrane beta-barrel protein [Psychroserpens sp.]MBO6606285.1 porin family protein [Psychroserpens sp.]MBO6631363.1 porin family protein [Psychroserpens sp.]MBO6652989.1 porin family protein [Psychroserpens sp.]MBO6680984.1 porin family protein [Psychroserpens sp.]MBO6750060.1 porin family protein [Psychroserpens sp.]